VKATESEKLLVNEGNGEEDEGLQEGKNRWKKT
jgi:hypothetical protein